MLSRRWSWLGIALVFVLTEAVYFRPSVLSHGLLNGDYYVLHARHLAFARDALFGPRHFLPGWYPRELLGAPFRANIQSFPWIPTRLVLLLFDPKLAYPVGVLIAAALASVSTYLFSMRIGLSNLGAIAAGWTFACAGFFSSRVMAGHLPMLEAYAALPLLLWLADRAAAPDRARLQVRDFAWLALCSACIALAGHPQLPAYALAAAALYFFVRARGRRLILGVSSIALGVGLALFALYPMSLLIQRSTRILPLAPAANDIPMPYGRLLALISPARDGWPEMLDPAGENPFHGYPNGAYFWDTSSYLGLVPLLAILLLFAYCFSNRRLPARPYAFVAALGIGAFVLSLPVAQPIFQLIPGTFLRSPARLFYVCTFSAAIALGGAVTMFSSSSWFGARTKQIVLFLFLCGHAVDLGSFSQRFVKPAMDEDFPQLFKRVLDRELDGSRIASSDISYHERYDDAGIFDSILLANPYRAMLGLAGLPPNTNQQVINAAVLPLPALQAGGVRFVITPGKRRDLDLVNNTPDENLYRVPDPFPRAAFFAGSQIDFVASGALDAFVAEPRRDRLLLPVDAQRTYVPESFQDASENKTNPVPVMYSRPSSDEIRIETAPDRSGFVTVLESFDPGWKATVDGRDTPVALANGFTMAVPVIAGKHLLTLRYETPGRRIGVLLSLASALVLAGLLWVASKMENPAG